MSIGVYVLKFNGTNQVYVGQSKRLEDRLVQHIRGMKTGKASAKLLAAYNKYGVPTMEVICECSEEELDAIENELILVCNSVLDGFNTMKESGHISSLYGEECGNSKYTNAQIIEVFDLLIDFPSLTHLDISSITGVSKSVICDLSRGATHKWLEDKYYDRYRILMELKTTRRKDRRHAASRNISYPIIVSPEGVEYEVTNIRGFSREHKLNPNSLGRVLRKAPGALSHKGWKIKT